jgi:riboflavin kinase/FMN adenylyltransferase
MEYISGTTEFCLSEPSVISLGKFDGLHRGHELLIEYMLQKKQEGLKSVIFTFDIPPKKLLSQDETKVLTTNDEKMHIFERIGIDYLIECPFTQEFMCMEPFDFIQKIVKELHVKAMVVGKDFHFGHNRSGDYHTLKHFAKELDYEVFVVDKMQYENRDISSTFIREEIVAGNIEKANDLLGYHYFVKGIVEHGKHLGGPVLGFPTANLVPPDNKLLPSFGVYITQMEVDDKLYQGIANVGCKPTIEGENPVGVEMHIFDFNQNIYYKEIRVDFLSRVRPELKFDSMDELKKQMNHDVAYAREYFENH